MDPINTLNEVLEPVVEAPESSDAVDGTAEPLPEVVAPENQPEGEQPAAAPESSAQSREENSAMRQFRLERERDRREAEEARRQLDVLTSALKGRGYSGSPEEIADSIAAQATGRAIEEIRAEREQRENKAAEAAQRDAELDRLKKFERDATFERDLAAIKAAHPDVGAKNITELGDDFFKIMSTGTVDAVTAYEIVAAQKARVTKTPPAPLPKPSGGGAEKDYYTPEEVDRLTKSDLDKPGIMDRAIRSMTRWAGKSN